MEKCLVLKIRSSLFSALVDDLWLEITQNQRIRRRGFAPGLSDSEVITMEIVGEFQGIDTDKGIWSYFRGHWLNGRRRGRPALRLTSLKFVGRSTSVAHTRCN